MSSERFYEDTLSPAPRAQKGESLLAFVADYTAIDLETTGLDPRRDSVIEFGAIRVRGNCIDERFSARQSGRPQPVHHGADGHWTIAVFCPSAEMCCRLAFVEDVVSGTT